MISPLNFPASIAEWLKRLGIGLVVCGPWSFVALAMVEKGALGSQAVSQLIAWGPAALILAALYVLIERWAPRIVAAQSEGARAQQKLADSVEQLAARGDRDSRETLGMVRYTLDEMKRMHAAQMGAVSSLRREVAQLKGAGNGE
jgi:type VI protein secretion system component VasK